MVPLILAFLLLGAAVAGGGSPSSQSAPEHEEAHDGATEHDPRYGLLTPLPETGVPPIFTLLNDRSHDELAYRARQRGYARQIETIRRRHFARVRSEQVRLEGIALLREFTDPAAFRALVEELRDEADDVQLALLEHFAAREELGQAALAYQAINHPRQPIRYQATRRIAEPAAEAVKRVVDASLRSSNHTVANRAGQLAGALNMVEAIPLLIHAQAVPTSTPEEQTGDLAWIAIETQTVYVQRLNAVVGDNAGALVPVMGTLTEGSVLRAVDAVVVVYRTQVHDALVNLTTYATGESTADLAYDIPAWRAWYNGVYVPMVNEQQRIRDLAEQGVDSE